MNLLKWSGSSVVDGGKKYPPECWIKKKKKKKDMTQSSSKAIVMNSMSLKGWMGKLVWLPDTEVCDGVRWLHVGVTGSGCLALVLDKHSVGRCQRLH